ncbi:hypothetical protein BU15DRAFT_75585 [Melanogaster broomeanus]|nr:hypothetical protein BU15DRAFT_75585 [Melanogaster broomeanus]
MAGFTTSGSIPIPMLYFESVGSGATASAQFHPILRAYITSEYQESEILRSAVAWPVLWERNLPELDESSTWALSRNVSTGEFTLIQV